MQVWNLLHAAHGKRRTQKSRQKSPSGHHRTTLSGYIFATKARIDNRKKPVKQQYVHHMSAQYGELRRTSGWDRLTSLGHPCNFQLVSRLGSVTARHLVVGASQTLRRWTEGATYVRQGDHHVGHWPTFLVFSLNWTTSLFKRDFSCSCTCSAGKDFSWHRASRGCDSCHSCNNSPATRVLRLFAVWLLSGASERACLRHQDGARCRWTPVKYRLVMNVLFVAAVNACRLRGDCQRCRMAHTARLAWLWTR